MKLKVLLLSASVAFLAVTGSVSAGNPKSVQNAVVVSSKSTYAPGSAEAELVLQWLKQRSPEYSPVLDGVTVVVRKTASAPNSPGTVTKAVPGPPVSLPNSGQPGDEFTVTITDRLGNSETWGYQWVSEGGWVIVEYHFKAVVHENQDSPETLG